MKKYKYGKRKKFRRRYKKQKNNLFKKRLSLFIKIIILIILVILKTNIIFKNYQINHIQIIDSNHIMYKGEIKPKDELLNDYLSKIKNSNTQNEIDRFNQFICLPRYYDDSKFKDNIKSQILNLASVRRKKNITRIDIFFANHPCPFWNSIASINNFIFYCEIIGCNTIILKPDNSRRWLITNPLYIKKLNITIKQGLSVDCDNENILCLYEYQFDLFGPIFVKPEIRINYIRDDILKNLPIVNIDPNDLYIHIRGGNVFQRIPSIYYAQPPLCYYEKIIDNNKFKNIYIVSEDSENVVINPLMKKYKNIIFEYHNLEHDISLLAHSYNLAITVSSFSIGAIKLNKNLRDLWEYDIINLTEKFLFLHHHFYKIDIKYKIHTMKPSDIYFSEMFEWRRTEKQIKLMLEDSCPYDFVFTKLNV